MIVHSPWSMDYGPWTMDYGLWTMDYGLWYMNYVQVLYINKTPDISSEQI